MNRNALHEYVLRGTAEAPSSLAHLRVDQLGSLVRPPALIETFALHASGRVTDGELRRAQDDAISDLVRRQEGLGLPIVGDGEYRRATFLDSFAAVRGIDTGTPETSAELPLRRRPVNDRLELVRNRLFDEYSFVKTLTDVPAKVTFPSADLIWQQYAPDRARQIYPDDAAFIDDVIAVQRQMIGEVAEAGCQYLQIDGPGYAAYADPAWIGSLRGRGLDPLSVLQRSADADRAVISGYDGVTFGIHLCSGARARGLQGSATYEGMAEALFNTLPHHRFLLEYEPTLEHKFETLRFVPRDRVVVLGLISTRTSTVENAHDLLRDLEAASKYVDMDQLALSPQCGFSSGISQQSCSQDVQWRKLELMLEVASLAWV
jgi:5-methyltetrahydropteroyltriglutamate--homocysteine methyltransferase